MINLGHLNEKQREAALHGEGPLLILAGAGSGKTSVMTHRIARLVLDEGVDPRNILAVTFTNKAAGEMRERVARLIYGAEAMEENGDGLLRAMSGYGGLWILTFHAACLRILHSYADRLGYTNGFAVYDPSDQKAVAKRCVKALGLDPKQYSAAYVLSAISGLKEDGKSPAEALAEAEGQYVGPRRRDIAILYKNYSEMLKRNNAMDFDDLLLNAVRLFGQNADVLERYQNRFHYIMVDEYQDTNRLQYLFVKMLAAKRGNLCVVGDDDQSIYGWRGADIRNILDFEKDFKAARVVKLEQNYRSCGFILDCANSVIRGNPDRKDKALWTDRGAGDKVIYRMVADEKEEARFVADEMRRLADGGRRLRDMAVLTRTNAQSRTFEEAFIAHGVEYRMLGQVRYYDRKEIKDMLSYMALAANPKDDVALLRIINEPRRGIGGKGTDALAAAAAQRGLSILELLAGETGAGGADGTDSTGGMAGLAGIAGADGTDSAGDAAGLSGMAGLAGAASADSAAGAAQVPLTGKAARAASEFAAVMMGFAEACGDMKVSELYDELLAKTGYVKALEEKGTPEEEARIENLLEFRSAIIQNEAEDPELALSDFLEKTALMSDVDNLDKGADAVTVMTLHSAKGLEFPVVFMPGMEEGLFPTQRSIGEDGRVDEERRLCYVGMTRAMDRLYLLRAKVRTLYGRRDYTLESRFLSELDKSVLDEGADKPGGDLTGYLHGDLSGGWGGARPFGESGRRPIDAFGAARADVKQREEAKAISVGAGDRVRHRKFGAGLVIEAANGFATVMFDTEGRKKLALDLAPLSKEE
ncbi:MAG: UvrD-helicase domain-containing protein [Clostridiales Family XIII bacterium]|jgi:DNA helicase-2/ATP-dependent DNA helicase PcrA|nr:UvrD-helicase domain-containing protein [Clostridiales Family XIII bacterium]